MTTSSIGISAWESVVTTSTQTVFQNKSINHMYVTTESTGGLSFDAGFYLAPGAAIILDGGVAVSAVAFRSASELFYMTVQ
jgi:hypothetical protein